MISCLSNCVLAAAKLQLLMQGLLFVAMPCCPVIHFVDACVLQLQAMMTCLPFMLETRA